MLMPSLFLICLSANLASVSIEDYLLVFSGDSRPYRATGGHTFAAVVRVERAADKSTKVVDLAWISWLPATMNVRATALFPEQGRNVPLDETLQVYTDKGSRLCMWGPYRIDPELGDIFRARMHAVETTFKYKAASLTSPRDVCDCARSVEEMVESRRRFIGLNGYGAAASSVVVQKMSPWIIEPHETHPWVASMIGLDAYPIEHRAYGDFTYRAEQRRDAQRWRLRAGRR
jgi:hypothetical protein